MFVQRLLALLVVALAAVLPAPALAQQDDARARCDRFLDEHVRPALNRSETISPETIGAGGFLPATAPFATQQVPGPWAPMYPPNRAGGWGYVPTPPWPAAPTPPNSQSAT